MSGSRGCWHGLFLIETLLSQVKTTSQRRPQNSTPLPSHHRRSRTPRENRAEQGVRQPLTSALISETQPRSRRAKPKRASAQQSALLNHLPEPLAATCRSAQISITHHTQSGGHFMALFTQGCLSCLPSTFLPGAIYPQHKHSGLIKALQLLQLQADPRLQFDEHLGGQSEEDCDPEKLIRVRCHSVNTLSVPSRLCRNVKLDCCWILFLLCLFCS